MFIIILTTLFLFLHYGTIHTLNIWHYYSHPWKKIFILTIFNKFVKEFFIDKYFRTCKSCPTSTRSWRKAKRRPSSPLTWRRPRSGWSTCRPTWTKSTASSSQRPSTIRSGNLFESNMFKFWQSFLFKNLLESFKSEFSKDFQSV